jgi:hypothetical protein
MGRLRWSTAVVLLLTAGCADGSITEAVELPGPGSPLDDGFVVPVDSRLLGPIHSGDAVGGTGWSADLYVEGSAEGAMEDLLAQVEAHDLRLHGDCAVPYPETREWLGAQCRLGAQRIEDGFVRERVGIGIQVSAPGGGRGFASHLGLSYGRWDDGVLPPGPHADSPFEGLGAFPDPGPPPAIPDVDEAIETPELAPDDWFHVVPGTRVVAPVRTMDTRGFIAHLQVIGDLDEVVDETARRFVAIGDDDAEAEVTEGEWRGHRTIRVIAGEAGGVDKTMDVLVGGPGEPSWATVRFSED